MTSPTMPVRQPHLLLIPGYWLGAWAWDEVLGYLTSAGAQATALTLPGLDPHDPQRTDRTLDDQARAITMALRQIDGDAVLVAHSGANGPVSLVLDEHPELVRRVIWVDSGPVSDGGRFAPGLPEAVTEVPLPDFEILGQQASLEGLDQTHLDRFRSRAVAEPAQVARPSVELGNDARNDVATTLICCSIRSDQVFELAKAEDPMFAAVGQLTTVDAVDLPTGHWPMWSRPEELAETILAAAVRPE